MFYQKKGKGKMRNHSRDQKNYHSSFIGKVMKINIQHRKRDKVSETCIDLVDKVVYVKPRNKLIIVKFHQHKGKGPSEKQLKDQWY